MQNPNIDVLTHHLNLSPYQARVLKANQDVYDIGRMVKRGRALYVPRRGGRNLFVRAINVLRGPRADVIGPDAVLVTSRRGIRFIAGGYFSFVSGDVTRYANDCGLPMTRAAFDNACQKSRNN